MLVALLLTACDPDKVDDATLDSGLDSSDDWNSENEGGDDAPEIQGGEAWCTVGSNSSGDLFFVRVDVSDAQGEDTLSSQDSRVLAKGGSNTVFEESILFCSDQGRCEGSWRSGDYGGSITCATATSFEYYAVIVDFDGHESEEFELTWTE